MGMRPVRQSGLGQSSRKISVDFIEVTQTVQDISHSVVLISEKPTVVRLCISTDEGSPFSVRGELGLSRGPLQTTVSSLNIVDVDPTNTISIKEKREDLGRTLNFILPESFLAAGQLEVSLNSVSEANSGELLDISQPTTARTVSFSDSAPMRLAVIGIRYHSGDPDATFVPRQSDISLLGSWLKRAYPISQLNLSYRVVDSNFEWPFTATQVNAQLTAIRNQDVANGTDARTHYYGIVDDDNSSNFMRGRASGIPQVPDPSTVASGPTGSSSFGWDFDGSYGDWYGAHELAHTFGRFHPGFCSGNSSDDPNFPYADGQISDSNTSFVGFDFGDSSNGILMSALPGEDWHDVMTYCSNQWLSKYTYEGIHQRILSEDSLGSGLDNDGGDEGAPAPQKPHDETDARSKYWTAKMKLKKGDYVNVVATLNLTAKTAKIQFVNPVAACMQPTEEPKSNVKLQLVDENNSVVKLIPVQVKFDSCLEPTEGLKGIVDASVIIPSGVVAIELTIDDKVVDRFRNGPKMIAAAKNVRRKIEHGMPAVSTAIQWDSEQADDTNITYSVQASTDKGQTWSNISIGRSSPEISFDKTEFEGRNNILIRVVSTNGFEANVSAPETIDLD